MEEEQRLRELEEVQATANQVFGDAYGAYETASEKLMAARDAIEAKRANMKWYQKGLDAIANCFVKDTEINAADSLMEQCVGECIAQFPSNASWIRGHSKVSINGEQILLRRCSRMCNFGGRITILMSGQPE